MLAHDGEGQIAAAKMILVAAIPGVAFGAASGLPPPAASSSIQERQTIGAKILRSGGELPLASYWLIRLEVKMASIKKREIGGVLALDANLAINGRGDRKTRPPRRNDRGECNRDISETADAVEGRWVSGETKSRRPQRYCVSMRKGSERCPTCMGLSRKPSLHLFNGSSVSFHERGSRSDQ